MKPITVLSLFDGISCGRVALERAGILVSKYYASEIDKSAITITMKNYPDTIQLGDVTKWREWDIDWASVDLLIGGSPCFPSGTLIMTNNGFKNIEDIEVGDLVLTHKSRYRKVLKVGSRVTTKIYKVKGMGLDDLETTAEHPFYAREKYKKWNNYRRSYDRLFKEPEWRQACQLNKDTYIGSTYNTEPQSMQGIHRPYDTNFWYYVGRFTADGWILKTKRKYRKNSFLYKVMLCCGKHEFKECENLMNSIGYNYGVTEDRTTYKFCISNQELMNYLSMIQRGALNKVVHPHVWHLPVESKEAFLRGYFDGDGSIRKSGEIQGISTSKRLIYGLKILINEVYNRPSSIFHDKRSSTYIIEGRVVKQHDTYTIRFKKDTNEQDKAFKDEKYTWSPVSKVDIEDKVCTVYNIEVEEDNSYTANTIVVHNCQGFSYAGKQLNFDDPRSKLFFEYVDILNHLKKHNPNIKFLLENVKMKKEFESVITSYLGVEPVEINSNLLSAQNRRRLYWTNWDFKVPEDKGILLEDIVHEYKDNMSQEDLKDYIVPFSNTLKILDKEVERGKIGYFGKDSQANRVYSIHGKAVTLCGSAGGGAAKMGQYLFGCITPDRISQRQNGQRFNDGNKFYTLTAQDRHGVLIDGYIRKLTPIECERLQNLEDNYTNVPNVSETQRYKALGNGWTVDVIAHILNTFVIDFK